MTSDALKILRVAIVIQLFIAAWFVFSPDILPELIKQAEMQNDQPIYATLDTIIVPLAHLQTLLCALLWWPKKFTSWAYLAVIVTINVLGAFAGPSILSAIDSVFNYVQVLASGTLLGILYLYKFFSINN
jgi:hypothetical protein